MSKTTQPELLLQAEMMGYPEKHPKGPTGLRGQGFYCEKQSERFKAGRPDLRVARDDVGQLDVELKVTFASVTDDEIEFGFTKLQLLHLKTMNKHGIPAVGLVFFERNNVFVLTLDRVLRPGSTEAPWTCLKLPSPQIIDGVALFEAAKGLLSAAGYRIRR